MIEKSFALIRIGENIMNDVKCILTSHIFDDGQDAGRCSCKLVDQSFFYERMLMIKKSFVLIR